MKIIRSRHYILYTTIILMVLSSCQKKSNTSSRESAEFPIEEQKAEASAMPLTADSISEKSNAPSAGDNKQDVHSLGWSKNGKILAYRAYFLSNAISRHSYFNLEATDIVSDKVVWNFSKSWDDGNEGEGATITERSPDSGEEAWQGVSEEVLIGLSKLGINALSDPSFNQPYSVFPFQLKEDEFAVALSESEEDNSYKIVVTSKQKGTKTVFTKQKGEGEIIQVDVLGYFMNPQKDRIAIVFREISFSANSSSYYVTGCELYSGFEADGSNTEK